VHRDFNPANVFLYSWRRCVCIGDIGMPRLLKRRVFERRANVGDGVYTSPELMRAEPCTHHVDLWALGCVCFELCTLKLPFQAASPLDLALQVIENEPDWSLWNSFSEELRGAVAQLLHKAAADRPSAGELLAESLFPDGLVFGWELQYMPSLKKCMLSMTNTQTGDVGVLLFRPLPIRSFPSKAQLVEDAMRKRSAALAFSDPLPVVDALAVAAARSDEKEEKEEGVQTDVIAMRGCLPILQRFLCRSEKSSSKVTTCASHL